MRPHRQLLPTHIILATLSTVSAVCSIYDSSDKAQTVLLFGELCPDKQTHIRNSHLATVSDTSRLLHVDGKPDRHGLSSISSSHLAIAYRYEHPPKMVQPPNAIAARWGRYAASTRNISGQLGGSYCPDGCLVLCVAALSWIDSFFPVRRSPWQLLVSDSFLALAKRRNMHSPRLEIFLGIIPHSPPTIITKTILSLLCVR